jgi:hypothetical protein
MRSDLFKHVALAALIAVVLYAIAFWGIEHRRTRNGPWEVTFAVAESGEAAVLINQPRLGIAQVRLVFADQPAPANPLSQTRRFAQPQPVPFDLPFGRCIYMDTTFLPGVVTFDFFDHEVELLPRTLIVDKREMAWRTGEAIRVTGPGVKPKPPPKR